MMTPALRKFTLTAHVTTSVGWLGAVAAFLVLAAAGLASTDAQLVRAAYLTMDLLGWFLIVPLSLASLLTGLVQGVGTRWGLLQHYWVLIKLLMTALATLVLLLHMDPVSNLARLARETPFTPLDFHALRVQVAVDAGAALLVLLVATVMSVFKPRGLTRYGRRRQGREMALSD
jgi:hypothetical protein